MNVSLTSELERFVRESVASGHYKSASEVVRDALRLLQEIHREREMRQQSTEAKYRELLQSTEAKYRELRHEVLRPLLEGELDPRSSHKKHKNKT